MAWWHFLLLVVVNAAIIQVGGRVIGADVVVEETDLVLTVVLSGEGGADPEASPLSLLVLPTMIALALLLRARRHRIEPECGQML